MSDLVSGLLVKLSELERIAQAAAGDSEPVWETTDLSESIYTAERGIKILVGPWGGDPGPAGLHVEGDWDAKLAHALAALGVTPKQGRPAWLLLAAYG